MMNKATWERFPLSTSVFPNQYHPKNPPCSFLNSFETDPIQEVYKLPVHLKLFIT